MTSVTNQLRFDGRVAIVTGSGRGIGKEIAVELARRGCKVVINDIGLTKSEEGKPSVRVADLTVQEIRDFGGEAIANYDSVEFGDRIVADTVRTWGRIDILVNNAGLLRDKSFHKMTKDDWDLVHGVHLRGSYKVTRAAWPHFRKQKYGKILMTCSISGLYGNFGQVNYSAAKMGLLGFANSLAREGEPKGIFVNSFAPHAATRMTKSKICFKIRFFSK